jgi:hypothetical protein
VAELVNNMLLWVMFVIVIGPWASRRPPHRESKVKAAVTRAAVGFITWLFR